MSKLRDQVAELARRDPVMRKHLAPFLKRYAQEEKAPAPSEEPGTTPEDDKILDVVWDKLSQRWSEEDSQDKS